MKKETILASIAIGILWLVSFYQLKLEWTVNPMYAYGWTIPALAGYLFYERWLRRPVVQVAPRAIWTYIPLFLVLLALLPVRVIQESNADWVKINWILLGLTCLATYVYLYLIGGHRYILHFFFPIAFTFTAVAWPYSLELKILQGLMRINAELSAEFMTLFMGLPAYAKGNLVFVNGNWVNVEEACSGIRSLQTAFMMSLFFGEFYSRAIFKRLILVTSSFLLAFVLNVIRTSTLTYISGTQGNESVDEWHDPLGYGILFCCIGGLWLLGSFFENRQLKAEKAVHEDEPEETKPEPEQLNIPGVKISISILVSILAIETITELWYRSSESQMEEPVEWSVQWPEEQNKFQTHEFPDRTYAILKYNEAESVTWLEPDNSYWNAYYIRWYPGRASKFLAGAHYPTVCLPATGLTLVNEYDPLVMEIGPLNFYFNTFIFDRQGRSVYVFHALVEDHGGLVDEEVTYKQVSSQERIDSAMKGNRNLGQRIVGISIDNANSLYEAREAVKALIPNLILFGSNPPANE